MTIAGVGLLPTGFVSPTIDQLTNDISTQYLTTIDPNLDLAPDMPMGQSLAISANRELLLWNVIGTIYAALDPDAAEGILLDNVGSLRGVRRRSATYSFLYGVQLALAATTTVNSGATISVSGNPSSVWVLLTTVTSVGEGTYIADFQSQVAGPQVANYGTATIIGTPTTGWTAVTNPTDAAQGIPEDTDTTYRLRQLEELGAASVGPVDGQRAAILNITGITSAFVFENTGNVIDGNGVAPHNTHAIVYSTSLSIPTNNSPLANEIAQAIWDHKSAGNGTTGGIYGTIVDTAGADQTLFFDWATTKPVYVTCIVTPAPNVIIGSGQATAIKANLAAYALANWTLGTPVYYVPFRDAAIVTNVSVDVPTFEIGFSPAPSGTIALPISGLEIATLDTSNITVNGI